MLHAHVPPSRFIHPSIIHDSFVRSLTHRTAWAARHHPIHLNVKFSCLFSSSKTVDMETAVMQNSPIALLASVVYQAKRNAPPAPAFVSRCCSVLRPDQLPSSVRLNDAVGARDAAPI